MSLELYTRVGLLPSNYSSACVCLLATVHWAVLGTLEGEEERGKKPRNKSLNTMAGAIYFGNNTTEIKIRNISHQTRISRRFLFVFPRGHVNIIFVRVLIHLRATLYTAALMATETAFTVVTRGLSFYAMMSIRDVTRHCPTLRRASAFRNPALPSARNSHCC